MQCDAIDAKRFSNEDCPAFKWNMIWDDILVNFDLVRIMSFEIKNGRRKFIFQLITPKPVIYSKLENL